MAHERANEFASSRLALDVNSFCPERGVIFFETAALQRACAAGWGREAVGGRPASAAGVGAHSSSRLRGRAPFREKCDGGRGGLTVPSRECGGVRDLAERRRLERDAERGGVCCEAFDLGHPDSYSLVVRAPIIISYPDRLRAPTRMRHVMTRYRPRPTKRAAPSRPRSDAPPRPGAGRAAPPKPHHHQRRPPPTTARRGADAHTPVRDETQRTTH